MEFKCFVDRSDCLIQEPISFNAKWCSDKFNGAGFRNEDGVSIKGGNIIWVHGPFLCGKYSDLRVFRPQMKTCLLQNERVVADAGYPDPKCSNGMESEDSHRFSFMRASHEATIGVSSNLKFLAQNLDTP